MRNDAKGLTARKATTPGKRRIVYVESFSDLPKDQAEFATGIRIVWRRSRKDAPVTRIYRVTLCSQQKAERIRELRRLMALNPET